DSSRQHGSPKLCRKCQPHSGEYWPMISHIKHVTMENQKKRSLGRERDLSLAMMIYYRTLDVDKFSSSKLKNN
ncbi:CC-NBS-LRR disease resistance protein, partial [Trifolium medium]|nr:CC-NBS-LRR disease resistance protein [Trifolium medium]